MPEVSPASRMSGRRSPSWRKTSSPLAQVGASETLALVPVRGTPSSEIRSQTTRDLGQRRAMRRVLAVTLRGRRLEASTTMVSGPGQQASARR